MRPIFWCDARVAKDNHDDCICMGTRSTEYLGTCQAGQDEKDAWSRDVKLLHQWFDSAPYSSAPASVSAHGIIGTRRPDMSSQSV